MTTKLVITAFCLFSLGNVKAQKDDSTAIKNQQLIEQLKNRINAIDNIGNGTNSFQKQMDELKAELARQNDSITKLLKIITDLKQHAPSNYTPQKVNTKLVLNSENDVLLSAKTLSDKQYNELFKSEAFYREYVSGCNCSAIFYKPYQVELNFKTIAELDQLIKNYESNSNRKITIVGHADKSGDESKNVILSKQRAENLKKYLIIASDKIKKENIIIEWEGSSKPIQNLPEDKQQLNRRVEISLQ